MKSFKSVNCSKVELVSYNLVRGSNKKIDLDLENIYGLFIVC